MSTFKNKKLFLKAIKQHIPIVPCLDYYFGIVDVVNKIWAKSPKVHTDYIEREKIHQELKNIDLPIIIILLESPHKDEFNEKPYMPAKGDTGKKILQYFPAKCPALPCPKYRVLLVNAIQYQCSLGVPTKNNRTDIFLYMWSKKNIKRNLEKRLKKYSSNIIINCCTKSGVENLRCLVQKEISKYKYEKQVKFYSAVHPSIWKNTSKIHLGGWQK